MKVIISDSFVSYEYNLNDDGTISIEQAREHLGKMFKNIDKKGNKVNSVCDKYTIGEIIEAMRIQKSMEN